MCELCDCVWPDLVADRIVLWVGPTRAFVLKGVRRRTDEPMQLYQITESAAVAFLQHYLQTLPMNKAADFPLSGMSIENHGGGKYLLDLRHSSPLFTPKFRNS